MYLPLLAIYECFFNSGKIPDIDGHAAYDARLFGNEAVAKLFEGDNTNYVEELRQFVRKYGR